MDGLSLVHVHVSILLSEIKSYFQKKKIEIKGDFQSPG